ncbi:MAG: hypothetical protein EPGJADBJ_02114 [Saprospiraceae bacterium]|nr:hypothetical protein [Saprospiraceae bacterium]
MMDSKNVNLLVGNNVICHEVMTDNQFAQAIVVVVREDSSQPGKIRKQVYFV